MGPDAVAIFVGNGLATRSADTEFPFRQDSDFWYLTGFDHPDAVAVLSTREGPDFTLFVQPRDRAAETWTGYRPGTDGAKADYAADEAHPREDFLEKLPDLLRGAARIYHTLGRDPQIDARIVSLQDEIRRQSRGGILPADALIDPRLIVHEMRLFKCPAEIELMQRAADISFEAHHGAARLAQPGRMEYELEAELGRVFRARGGSGPAYGSIVGGGKNATILHYIRNDQPLVEGEVVLIDAGVEYQSYASDVTRTYPVGGRFAPAARDLYEVVLSAQLAAMEASRPGTTLPDIHAAAVRRLTEGMIELGILSGDIDELIQTEKYKPYYMHGTSHWLGLDVHDVGAYVSKEVSKEVSKDVSKAGAKPSGDSKENAKGGALPRPLEPGMAYTIEPGLYIAADDPDAPDAFKGIGIRIEDDVVITEDGVLNLTREIPKAIDDIEAWVRGD
jgi:Xaa-Pro aminopeptidase